MSEPRWQKVAGSDELRPGDVRQLRVLARAIAVFNIDGRLWAIDGLCRHMHGKLALGKVKGTVVTCPRHGWTYDVTDGRCLTAGQEWATLRTYAVRIEHEDVFVDVAPIFNDVAQANRRS